jgi:hypothetical protein
VKKLKFLLLYVMSAAAVFTSFTIAAENHPKIHKHPLHKTHKITEKKQPIQTKTEAKTPAHCDIACVAKKQAEAQKTAKVTKPTAVVAKKTIDVLLDKTATEAKQKAREMLSAQ